MLLLVFFLSANVVEFNFSRNIMQTEYTAPTFCLYECNRFQMYFSLYDQKSVSYLFIVFLRLWLNIV